MSAENAEKTQEGPQLRSLGSTIGNLSPSTWFLLTMLVSLSVLATVVNMQIQPGLDLLKPNMIPAEREAAVNEILKGTAWGAVWASLSVFVGSSMQWNDGGRVAAVGRGLTAGAAGAILVTALYTALTQLG